MRQLRDSGYKSYNYVSRYTSFPYYFHNVDNKYIYGTTSWLDTNTSYISHVVQEGDTFDILLAHYYGNPTKYWMICDFNRISDPFSDLTPGDTIKIPVVGDIKFLKNL